MNIIVCLDDKNGMLFNRRRQSTDSVLCHRILERTRGSALWMNSYSAKLFSAEKSKICVDEAFMDLCGETDWGFVENTDIIPYKEKIKKMIIYRWNRNYPSDTRFPVSLFENRWSLESTCEFAGSSHACITEEVYTL